MPDKDDLVIARNALAQYKINPNPHIDVIDRILSEIEHDEKLTTFQKRVEAFNTVVTDLIKHDKGYKDWQPPTIYSAATVRWQAAYDRLKLSWQARLMGMRPPSIEDDD